MDRREFLSASALGAGLLVVPSYVAGQSPSETPPSRRVNLAIIGVGGRGITAVLGHRDDNIVAFCDVDMHYISALRQDPNQEEFNAVLVEKEKQGARWFQDYRIMFEEMADEIDGVVITTPDHMHFPIVMTALNLKKHVYCEKPLCHTVEEARIIAEAAKKAGVVTSMGNQGHSYDGTRLAREWLQAGVIGPVHEVHSWTDRPIWPQGKERPDHSKKKPAIPYGLNWNLWLGVAPYRDYDPIYVPFGWRGWHDFGAGAFGDMACHGMDAPYWGLDLTYPETIETVSTPVNEETFPTASLVTYEIPARGSMPKVTYKWYDGGLKPTRPSGLSVDEMPDSRSGTLIVGEDGMIYHDEYCSTIRILPRSRFMELRSGLPERTERRIKGSHRKEWINAILEGREASSPFSYAAPFTELVLLGNVALRAGTRLEYDAVNQKFTNEPSANALLRKDYPDGWILG